MEASPGAWASAVAMPTGATAVQQIRTVDAHGVERYYDLNGRLLQDKPRRGLYIHNGKKHFILKCPLS